MALYPNVEFHVRVQVRLLVEPLGANFALEGAMASAHHHVPVKLLLVQKDLAAKYTLVSPL